MGLIRGSFSLSNPTRPDLAPLEVSAARVPFSTVIPWASAPA